MKQKIESPALAEQKGPNLIAEWIFAFCLGGAIYLFSRNDAAFRLDPWTAAAFETIRRGIAEFHGGPVTGNEPDDRSLMLVRLLIAFVAGPTIFLFSWRKLRLGGIPQSFVATLCFVAGGAATLSVFAPSIPDAVNVQSASIRIADAHAVQAAKGELMLALNEIAVDARSYSIKGDGGKGFDGYSIPGRLIGPGVVTLENGSGESGSLRITGSLPAYAGSSVALELDSTRSRFRYEGVFNP